MRGSVFAAATLAVLLRQAAVAAAQAVPSQAATFAVTTVKPSPPGALPAGFSVRGEQVRAGALTLAQMVNFAWNLMPQRFLGRVEGGPAWMMTERFDVGGKAARPLTVNEARLMIRGLLADRFQLKTRIDTRQVPVYALSVVRADGTLGPGLKRSKLDCAAYNAAAVSNDYAEAGKQRTEGCGVGTLGSPSTELVIKGATSIDAIIPRMSRSLDLDRPILNRTNLTGTFDIDLHWSPGSPGPRPTEGTMSLYTALRQQLGLKLEPQTGPIEVLVIDGATHPTPD